MMMMMMMMMMMIMKKKKHTAMMYATSMVFATGFQFGDPIPRIQVCNAFSGFPTTPKRLRFPFSPKWMSAREESALFSKGDRQESLVFFGTETSESSSSTKRDNDNNNPRNDHPLTTKYSKIRKGELYVESNFLTKQEIELLRKDIDQLKEEGCFRPSGLSNRVEGDQNIFGPSDRWTCTLRSDLWPGDTKYSGMRNKVETKMEDLKKTLQVALGRGLEEDYSLELAEMYHSISPKGSTLPRHQDERHEDTKGQKAWVNETRRSISWLIYLNDEGWGDNDNSIAANPSEDNRGLGGELRAYVRKFSEASSFAQCGSHEGNLQVGWLRCCSCCRRRRQGEPLEFEPVFLDSWVKTENDQELQNADDNIVLQWKPMSALYRLRRDETSTVHEQQTHGPLGNVIRDYVSKPFGPNSPSWPSTMDLEPSDFAEALSLQLTRKDHQHRFVGTEELSKKRKSDWNGSKEDDLFGITVVDVQPKGGTLVLFDSVTVPHEVLEVMNGTRFAIAGWFHEDQQSFPDWYGT